MHTYLFLYTHGCIRVCVCVCTYEASQVAVSGKEPTCQCRKHKTWVQSLG